MSVCLRRVKMIIRDQFFFSDFAFVCSEEGYNKGKTYPVIDSPVHGEHNGETFSSVPQSVDKLQLFL